MAAFNFLKHPYIVISSFFLYITFIARWHKINIDIKMYNENVSYQTLISVCLICLLFLLPSLFRSRRVCIIKKPVENKLRFFANRFCSGLFFLLGNYYLHSSFILSQDLIKIYKADIAWTQILAVSVLFLASFYLPKRVRLFSFVGIILFLFGFVSLFHTSRIFDHLTLMSLLVIVTNPVDLKFHISYLFLFVLFWLFTIKINKSDAKYFENNAVLWLSTLLFSILISFLILLYTEQISILLKNYASGIFIIYNLPYGMFLWFCIKLFCFLDLGNKNKISAKLLDGWLLSILTMAVLTLLYDVQNVVFLFKCLFIAVGMYLIWNPNQLQISQIRMTERKQIIILILFSGMFSAILFYIIYRLSTYSLDIYKMVRDLFLMYFVSEESMFNNTLARVVLKALHQVNEAFKYMRGNIFAFGSVTSCFISLYLYKRYAFKENILFLLNCIFAGIIAWLFAGLLWDFCLVFIYLPSRHITWFYKFRKEHAELLFDIIRTFQILIIYYSFKQALQRGKRLVLWTVFSNYALYISLSYAASFFLMYVLKFFNVNNFDDLTPVFFSVLNMANIVIAPLIILAVSVLICGNKNIEERILPTLLQCRPLNVSEKQKFTKVLAVLQEKDILPDITAIQIYISRITEFNAYTIGKMSIAVTYSLFQKLTPQQIAGIISHEFGHIKHNDGDLRVLLYALNFPATLIKKIYNAISFQRSPVLAIISSLGLFLLAYTHMLPLMGVDIFLCVMFWFLLQTAIFLMENQDLQDSEWMADEYAASKGLGQELREALTLMATVDETNDDNDREPWMEKYPDLAERIRRLETLQNPIGV